MKIVTNNFEETQKFASEFAQQLKGGDTLLLFGNLGAGKTTFMQGLAKGLGIKRRIISPTFIIMRKYTITDIDAITSLYHVDLYRTETRYDLEGIGLPDVLQDKSAIAAIEWPEKLGSLIPQKQWELHFETMDENTRSITIEKLA